MSKGVLMFAHNNREIDYVRMASAAARFVKKNLGVPVSLVTDQSTVNWALSQKDNPTTIFDTFILTDDLPKFVEQDRRYYDGSIDYKKTRFNNNFRTLSYQLSPYDETLVMDTDLLITNDNLKHIWDTDVDFMINSKHYDLSSTRRISEFERTSDHGIDFYWATIFYFKKNDWTKTFFDLCQHIVENYEFYTFTYRMPRYLMRNDYVFSVAIHIMNGFNNKTKPAKLPCDIYFTVDKDELYQVTSDTDFTFLVQKEDHLGQYTLVRTSRQNVHVMNKYSFNRHIPNMLEVLDVN